MVNGLLSGAAGLLILLAYGPWILVPAWIWGALTGAAAALAAYAVLRARTLPSAAGTPDGAGLGQLSVRA